MGLSMCRHLVHAGHPMTIHSRTAARGQPLLSEPGVEWAGSPGELAEQSDVIFSIVGYPDDVRNIHLETGGTIAAARPGTILVDMTTSSPELAREIYQRARENDLHSIDAPVSGGDTGARNATLSIMLGGDAEPVQKVLPLLRRMGKTIVHQGAAGCGQHTKMANQILIATNMIGVCESLLYAWRAGLDLEKVMQSVSSGAASSWSLSNLAPRIMAGDFAPGFFVEHFVKDIGIALSEAGRMNLNLPGLQLARQLYLELQNQGGSRMGTQALQLALARLSGLDWEKRGAAGR